MAVHDVFRPSVDYTYATQINPAIDTGKVAFIPFYSLASTNGTPLGTAGNPLVTSGTGGGSAMSSAEFLANLRSTATKGTPVNSGTSSVTLLAANAARKGACFVNTDANILYIDISGGTATNTGVPVASGGYYELPFGLTNAITGIWAADGAGVCQPFEAA